MNDTQLVKDSLYLLRDGYRSEDHPIMTKAHLDVANHEKYARVMAASTSEIQAIKYLQYLIESRPIEPGFRTKEMDIAAGMGS